ncbi:hypothetical protein ACFE04_020963 [Oxalis oulophora]
MSGKMVVGDDISQRTKKKKMIDGARIIVEKKFKLDVHILSILLKKKRWLKTIHHSEYNPYCHEPGTTKQPEYKSLDHLGIASESNLRSTFFGNPLRNQQHVQG